MPCSSRQVFNPSPMLSVSSKPSSVMIAAAGRHTLRRWCSVGLQEIFTVRSFSKIPSETAEEGNKKAATLFEPWWDKQEIDKALETGEVRYGRLHVPAFETNQAFIELDDGEGKVRVKVPGFMARNRAVHGDYVMARLMWKAYKRDSNENDDKTTGRIEDARARVVSVMSRNERPVVGLVMPGETKVQPRDQRLPAMTLKEPFDGKDVMGGQLVTCRIIEWKDDSVNPICELVEHFGPVGTGVAEHRAIMERYGLSSTEYTEEMEDMLKKEWPSSEAVVMDVLKGKGPKRWDLRKSHRVVSIDPPTAKDLDDALSVELLDKGRLRIGVHVADVPHFVPAHSKLDIEAAKRSITVYMPHKTYPMLPRHLSENLCSLLPNVDRLAFTVFFVVDQQTGELCKDDKVEFGKSIIRSSARLSYDEVDEAMGGEMTAIDTDVLADIKLLWDVAAKRRSSTRAQDTIRVGSSKIKFEFSSPNSFTPTKCWSESSMDSCGEGEHNSHGLIEEFMVLANRLVAERLVEGIEMKGESLPPILRQHPNTEAEVIETILPVLQRGCGEVEWSAERWKGRKLADLLEAARKNLPGAVYKAISFEAMVAFQMAEYIVVEDVEESTSHWALGLGRYMHFTSPIRRYADVLVHRLLADLISTGKESLYSHSVEELIKATAKCNKVRKGSLEADRECAYYFFSDYVRANYSDKNGLNLNDLVVTKIFPGKKVENGKSTKDAIEVFVPLVGYSKSVSLEQIGADSVIDISEKTVEFLRNGKTVKWKVLDIIEMNVVCASDSDSVLKHWTLRLPGGEESLQCGDVANGKSSECDGNKISNNDRKSSECDGNKISNNDRKSSECDGNKISNNDRKSSECDGNKISNNDRKSSECDGNKISNNDRKSSECDGNKISNNDRKSSECDGNKISNNDRKSSECDGKKVSNNDRKSSECDGNKISNNDRKSSECDGNKISNNDRKSSECDGNKRSNNDRKSSECDGNKISNNDRKSSECDGKKVSKKERKSSECDGKKKSHNDQKSVRCVAEKVFKDTQEPSECGSSAKDTNEVPIPRTAPPPRPIASPVLPMLPQGPAFAVLRSRLERSMRESNRGGSIAAGK